MDDVGFLEDELTPEELQQLLQLGTLDERGALLQQQLARAEALRRAGGARHTTGLGAALGGIGDVLGSVTGTLQGQQAQAGLEALLNQKDAARMAYAQNAADALRRRKQQAVKRAMQGGASKAVDNMPPTTAPISFFGR